MGQMHKLHSRFKVMYPMSEVSDKEALELLYWS